jgi:6-pyruvoyltetrahydropterin/6-carboxytetrahydropterin synthase
MIVGKEFTFDSAHFLPKYYGKCERMHGHTYRLRISVEGQIGENGLVMDFVILKKIVKEQVLNKLDHQLLNDVLEIPSCENIAKWIWEQLSDLKSLIEKQLDDPNLPDSITKYFKDDDASEMNLKEFSSQVKLHEVQLWETPTSFAIYNDS